MRGDTQQTLIRDRLSFRIHSGSARFVEDFHLRTLIRMHLIKPARDCQLLLAERNSLSHRLGQSVY